MSPPIQLFLTTIVSQPALRQRQELLLRTLQVKKIPYKSYDLASDEDAKRLWRRKAPADKQQLPGILVGGKIPGTFAEFEDAVEHGELDIFLRLKEDYDAAVEEDRPLLEEKVIGVPGVSPMPSPMSTPSKPRVSTTASAASALSPGGPGVPATPALPRVPPPTPIQKQNGFDVGDQLSGFGLQGVRVTHDDLAALVEELGLEGDEAADLVKGLEASAPAETKPAAEEAPATRAAPAASVPATEKEKDA